LLKRDLLRILQHESADSSPAQETIKIGLIQPMTGSVAYNGLATSTAPSWRSKSATRLAACWARRSSW
jgi:hypothetical protein